MTESSADITPDLTSPVSEISELRVPWETIGDAGAEAAEARIPDPKLAQDLSLTPWTEPAPRLVIAETAPATAPESTEMKNVPFPAREKGTFSFSGAGCDEGPAPRGAAGWTLPLLCAGIALIASAVLIPQADANRRLSYERQMLQMDLDSVEKQIAVNAEFLKKVGEDPTLAERLAERQMKVVPEGTRVLELRHEPDGGAMSPFQLVNVPPPPPMPAYKPVGGTLASLCYNARTRLYLVGIALGMMATGLVFGSTAGARGE